MCGGHSRNIGNLLIPFLAQVSELSSPVKEPVIWDHFTCPNCSSSIAPGYSWCPVCGSALRPQSCTYCGQTLATEDKHCQHCGAPRELVKNH